jgi:hypothetical protein
MADQDENKTEEPEGKDEATGDAAPKAEPPPPGEAFRQGLSLLWQAARGTADEIKREVDKGGVTDALKHAGRDLEEAANAAAKTLEGFIERVGPQGDHKPYEWPTGGTADTKASEKKSDDKAADDKRVEPGDPVKEGEDGGTTDDGERRDMRIQVEDE